MRHCDGQKGFTLIEVLVVMIVGIVILAITAAGIGKLYRASEIAEEVSNITQIRARLNGLIQDGGSEEITTKLAIKLKIIPANMFVYEDQVHNVWGNLVDISRVPKSRNISIDYYAVFPEACQQLVLKLANAGWSYIKINGGRISSTPTLKYIGEHCAAKGNDTVVSFVTGGASM